MYKIEVENSLCEGPFTCGKCFKVCPSLVFFAHPRSREPYKITNNNWIVTGIFVDQCIGCMRCVNACPKNAITIKEAG